PVGLGQGDAAKEYLVASAVMHVGALTRLELLACVPDLADFIIRAEHRGTHGSYGNLARSKRSGDPVRYPARKGGETQHPIPPCRSSSGQWNVVDLKTRFYSHQPAVIRSRPSGRMFKARWRNARSERVRLNAEKR